MILNKIYDEMCNLIMCSNVCLKAYFSYEREIYKAGETEAEKSTSS